MNIPPQEREIFASKFVLDLDFGDSALSALPEVVKLSREMELPPPHVLLQLDAIIVAQRESDGARVVATPWRKEYSAQNGLPKGWQWAAAEEVVEAPPQRADVESVTEVVTV